MLEKKFFAAASLFVALFAFGQKSYADDNVCLINNSSYAVTFEAGDQDTFNVAAKGGDQNKCWHFHTGATWHEINSGAFGINAKEGYGIKITAKTPGSPTVMYTGFVDPVIGAGHFMEWSANNKWCRNGICIWHTGKTDVWRLYVEDQK